MISKNIFLFIALIIFSISSTSAFSDDFNDGNLDGWTVVGSWSPSTTNSYDGTNYMSTSAFSGTNSITYYVSNTRYWEISMRGNTYPSCSGGVGYIRFSFEANATAKNELILQGCNGYYVAGSGFAYGQVTIASGSWVTVTIEKSDNNQNYEIKVYEGNESTKTLINTQTAEITNIISSPSQIKIDVTGSTVTAQTGNIDNIVASGIPPDTGTYVLFDAENYAVGDIIQATYVIESGFWDFLYAFKMQFVNTATNDVLYTYSNIPQSGTYFIQMTEGGSLRVEIVKTLVGDTVLASDSALVGEYVSYIFMNREVSIGFLHNVSYRWGFTPSGAANQWITTKYWDEITGAWVQEHAFAAVGTSLNTLYTTTVIFEKEGKYLVELKDHYHAGTAAAITINTFFSGGEPLYDFAVSNITILYKQLQYAAGDYLQFRTVVDSYNYSNYRIKVELYNYALNASQGLVSVLSEKEDYSIYLLNNMLAGESSLRLTARNGSAYFVLSYENLTISEIDSQGYGLSISKTQICQNDKILITAVCPGNCTLSLTDSKSTIINMTGTRTYNVKPLSDMSITLNDPAGIQKKYSSVDVGDCAVVDEETAGFGGTGEQTAMEIFSSPWLWGAILCAAFVVAGGSVGGIVGAIAGFGIGVVFSFIGGLIPLWALFIFVLLLILMISFSFAGKMGGGGD